MKKFIVFFIIGIKCIFASQTLTLPNTSIHDAKNAAMKAMKVSNVSDFHFTGSSDYSLTFSRNASNDSFWENVASRSLDGTIKGREEIVITFVPDDNATLVNVDTYDVYVKDYTRTETKNIVDSTISNQISGWIAGYAMVKVYNSLNQSNKVDFVTYGTPCNFKGISGTWLFRWEYGYICGDIQGNKLVKSSGM